MVRNYNSLNIEKLNNWLHRSYKLMHEPQFEVELLNQIEFLFHVPIDHSYFEVIWYLKAIQTIS